MKCDLKQQLLLTWTKFFLSVLNTICFSLSVRSSLFSLAFSHLCLLSICFSIYPFFAQIATLISPLFTSIAILISPHIAFVIATIISPLFTIIATLISLLFTSIAILISPQIASSITTPALLTLPPLPSPHGLLLFFHCYHPMSPLFTSIAILICPHIAFITVTPSLLILPPLPLPHLLLLCLHCHHPIFLFFNSCCVPSLCTHHHSYLPSHCLYYHHLCSLHLATITITPCLLTLPPSLPPDLLSFCLHHHHCIFLFVSNHYHLLSFATIPTTS
ncbi:unnamed protein product [Acanthosepion pharaonis]|uniref:Uncharacterized protein n=1 Tax=Acanthosepion pharaonis TaxID=158019 RepID=A0A812D300_ACAPH|nr:unnamed protein product [Sepia pharaonis]